MSDGGGDPELERDCTGYFTGEWVDGIAKLNLDSPPADDTKAKATTSRSLTACLFGRCHPELP